MSLFILILFYFWHGTVYVFSFDAFTSIFRFDFVSKPSHLTGKSWQLKFFDAVCSVATYEV